MIEHFGVNVNEDEYITRENYAIINKRNSINRKDENNNVYMYSDEFCKDYQEKILRNFDINIEKFNYLDADKFNSEIDNFLEQNRDFKQIFDLKEINDNPGYYIMVLDKYKQIYIGTSLTVGKRIKQHWKKKMPFDRLLFPAGNIATSKISIDSFKALDTTRIYFKEDHNIYESEDEYIKNFSEEFLLNRIMGGRITTADMLDIAVKYLFDNPMIENSINSKFYLEEINQIFNGEYYEQYNGFIIGDKIKLFEFSILDNESQKWYVLLLDSQIQKWLSQFNQKQLNEIKLMVENAIPKYQKIGRFDKVVDLRKITKNIEKKYIGRAIDNKSKQKI